LEQGLSFFFTCPTLNLNINPVMKLKPIKSNLAEITTTSDDQILISYDTPVAARIKGVYYRTAKKWSRTTNRHLSFWLEQVKAVEKDQSFFDDLLAIQA
jgi:hypothetical protein